jgi:hypothetical protein
VSQYSGIQDIYDALEDDGLLESQGRQVFPKDATSGAESTQGVLYSRSLFSDMEVACYYIDIFYLEGQSFEANVQQVHAARAGDENVLVAVAAESWCIILTRGDLDADIPGNIADLVLKALGEGEIVWSRQIPEAEWFTSPFTTAGDILGLLEARQIGFSRSRLDDAGRLVSADSYIYECIEADNGSFALATLDVVARAGHPATLLVDVFVEDQTADYLSSVFPSYFPTSRPERTLVEDGWLIRVAQDDAEVATSYDLEDAAKLLRAALFPAEAEEEVAPLRVYTFYTNDGGKRGIFGCRAETEIGAEALVRAAGHREYLLFDDRALESHETSAAATERILENPFLGAVWVPIVDAIDVATSYLRPGKFWTLDCYSRAYEYDPDASPYSQAILEDDGSLHIEVSGRNDANSPITGEQYAALEFLGWTSPTPSEKGDKGRPPNPSQVLEPGWNGRRVAELVLEALTIVYGVSEADLFNFGEALRESILNLGTLQHISGPIFGIPGMRPIVGEVTSAEAADHPTGTGKALSEEASADQARRKVTPSHLPHYQYPFGLTGNELAGAWKTMDALAERGDLRVTFKERGGFPAEESGMVSLEGLVELLSAHWGAEIFAKQIRKIKRLLAVFPEHPPIYGEVNRMLVTLDNYKRSLDRKLGQELPFESGAATAALMALFQPDTRMLEALVWHPCNLVRFAVAGNKETPNRALMSLTFDPSWEVRAETLEQRTWSERGESSYTADDPRKPLSECQCGSTSAVELMRRWFQKAALLPPAGIPRHLELLLAQQSDDAWSTQPMPIPIEDYKFSTVRYLSGPVPDQFAVNHAGHGANSYAISLRVVAGPVALLAQCLWGGVYTDVERSSEQWHEMRDTIRTILRRTEAPAQSGAHRRELVVSYSNFRTQGWTVDRLDGGSRQSESFESSVEMLEKYFPSAAAS